MERTIQVRILLAGMSKMLANVVSAALAPAADIVVTGSTDADDLSAALRATNADAVVTPALRPENGEAFRSLLLGFPAVKVIAIARNGRSGYSHELQLASNRLTELSSSTLLGALRGDPSPRPH